MKRNLKIFGFFAVILFIIISYSYITSLRLITTRYTVNVGFDKSIRIVHITDLHNAEFGQGNSKLISLIQEQDPDVIVMTGDMLNEDDSHIDVICNLVHELGKKYPVYFGYGNHEKTWENTFQKDIRELITDAGAVVVDNDYVDIDLNGNSIRIGGYMGYYRTPQMNTSDENELKFASIFFNDFEDTDRYKILLNHIPTNWLDWNYIDTCSVDLVLCGHYHGGVIRFFNRGLFAPCVGWFPPFTKGMFIGKKATCILSSGLGNEHGVPRLNNPPEVVVIDLK